MKVSQSVIDTIGTEDSETFACFIQARHKRRNLRSVSPYQKKFSRQYT